MLVSVSMKFGDIVDMFWISSPKYPSFVLFFSDRNFLSGRTRFFSRMPVYNNNNNIEIVLSRYTDYAHFQ